MLLFYLLLWCIVTTLQEQCPAGSTRAIQVSVSSRRNQTGHWISHILWDQLANAVEVDNRETAPVSFHLTQRVRGCWDAETLSMEAILTAPPAPAQPGYVLLPDIGRYKFSVTASTWDAARRTCSAEGGHLAVIRSKQQEDALKAIFARHPKIEKTTWEGAAWLGVHDQHTEGDFITVLSESFPQIGYSNWESNKPDNKVYDGFKTDSDCVALLRNGRLIDLPCGATYAFICEQDLF